MTIVVDPSSRANFGDVLRRANALSRGHELLLLVGAWVTTTAWVWIRLDQGWVPHDDGAFAESALRVLDGQLPHREFAELYTGAMTFLNAGAFAVLGEDLLSLRLPLFGLFLGFVPCVYYIARQFVGPIPAVLTALAGVTWGFPVYPAAVPSWYVLLFTLYGTVALVRWRQTNHDRWLVVAGVCGGLAIAFKIVGVYYVLAVVYFLVCCSSRAIRGVPQHGIRKAPGRGPFVASVAGVTLAVLVVTAVLGSHVGVPEVVNLIVPIATLSLVVLVWSWGTTESAGIGLQVRRISTFAAGVAMPLVLLAIPYVWAGAIGDLIDGVFLSPQSRREYAYLGTPDPLSLLPAMTIVVVLFLRHRLEARTRNLLDVGFAALAGLVLTVALFNPVGYVLYWSAGRGVAVVTVVVTAAALAKSRGTRDPSRSELLILLAALAAFTALVQFPFGHPVYYCYIAPIVVIAIVALVGHQSHGEGALPTFLLVMFVVFGAASLDRGSLTDLGARFEADPQVRILGPNASIRVSPSSKRQLDEVGALLQKHAHGEFAFAGPDLPHVYFLSGLKNPTRSLFDFLDTTRSARGQLLVETLRAKGVTAIAINLNPDLSDPLEPATLRELGHLYPHRKRIDEIEVRWTAR